MGVALLALFPITNDDAGFHIANGLWILENGSVPTHNPFTYAGDGATWIQHQWLSATLMGWLVQVGGAPLLVWAKVALFGGLFALLAWNGRHRLGEGWLPALFALAIGASCYRFVERPFAITLVWMAITAISLERWRSRGDQKALWGAALATGLSIHFHAGGIYCILLWFALLGDQGVALLRPSWSTSACSPTVTMKAFSGVVLGVVVSLALAAPSGLSVLTLPLGFSKHAYWNTHLGEFRPFPFHMETAVQWAWIAASLALAGWSIRSRNPFAGLVCLGFGLLTVRHARMISPLSVAVLAVLPSIRLPRLRPVHMVAVLAMGLGALGVGTSSHYSRVSFGLGEEGINTSRHPIHLYKRAKELPGETFVSDGLAGMWLWQVFDSQQPEHEQKRVLIHNCLECYEESTYKDVYQALRYGSPHWKTEFETLGIRSALLKHTTPGERARQEGKPNLRQLLFEDAGWILVDFDDVASLYVDGRSLPDAVTTLETPDDPWSFDPDSWRPRAPDTPWHQLKTDLEDHARSRPQGVRSSLILAQLGHQIGDASTVAEAVKRVITRKPDGPEATHAINLLRSLPVRR